MYSGMLWGIFPTDERVSWEVHPSCPATQPFLTIPSQGHVFGLGAGILGAIIQGTVDPVKLWCRGQLSDEDASEATMAHAKHTAQGVGQQVKRRYDDEKKRLLGSEEAASEHGAAYESKGVLEV